MSTYTMSDVHEAGRLWDEMPLEDVADQTGVAVSTLWRWSSMGLISTETNHCRKASAQTIQRADELYDVMPLRQVAEALGVSRTALGDWKQKGWISTEKDWLKINGGREKKTDPRLVVELYHDGYTQREVADEIGISRSTVGRYLRQYRNGEL
jgi:transcriptional regulator with XRE-family HTH domain